MFSRDDALIKTFTTGICDLVYARRTDIARLLPLIYIQYDTLSY